jgi:hypothetical protein
MSKKFPLPLGTRVRMKDSGASGVLGTVRDPRAYQMTGIDYTAAERLSWIKHPENRPGQDFFDQGWVSVKWDDDSTFDGFMPEDLEVVEQKKGRLRDWLTEDRG